MTPQDPHRPSRWLRGFASVLLLGTLMTLAGCAGGGRPAAKAEEVDLKNLQFEPREVTVAAGANVKWTNEDSTAHDVTGASGAFQSQGGPGGLQPGETWSYTFTQAGTFAYYCTVHSSGPGEGMSGQVVVTAAGGNATP